MRAAIGCSLGWVLAAHRFLVSAGDTVGDRHLSAVEVIDRHQRRVVNTAYPQCSIAVVATAQYSFTVKRTPNKHADDGRRQLF